MEIIKTERKHWINGYMAKGGGSWKSFAISIPFTDYAFMLTYSHDSSNWIYRVSGWHYKKAKFSLYFYKFI